MSISRISEPKAEPICIRVERILPRIEKSAGVKKPEIFRALMMDVVDRAHRMARLGPTSLKRTRRVRQLVCKLQKELTDNPDLSRYLEHVQHLEYVSKRLESSDAVKDISNLSDALLQAASALHWLERLKEKRRPGKGEERVRKQFVSGLLDAAALAGGELGVNRRNGRGSLVDAVDLLKPLLPELFQHGLSAYTLRTLKEAWLKIRKK